MAWMLWLAAPVVATTLAAVVAWWRARPAPRADAATAMRAHRAYLDALVEPARGTRRVPAPCLDGTDADEITAVR
jgi:hypothetical protein